MQQVFNSMHKGIVWCNNYKVRRENSIVDTTSIKLEEQHTMFDASSVNIVEQIQCFPPFPPWSPPCPWSQKRIETMLYSLQKSCGPVLCQACPWGIVRRWGSMHMYYLDGIGRDSLDKGLTVQYNTIQWNTMPIIELASAEFSLNGWRP